MPTHSFKQCPTLATHYRPTNPGDLIMFRNQYDSDVTTWSPQGRLHQVEYAVEAVKQGSTTVGLKNNAYAVLLALKRSTSELSAHQKKIFPIDDHIGISIAGLTADARILSRFMRNECANNKYMYESPLPVNRLGRCQTEIFGILLLTFFSSVYSSLQTRQ